MAGMECAHRRHQAEQFARATQGAAGGLRFYCCRDDLHVSSV